MADVITTSEWLEIGGYPFATPAAQITSLVPLFRAPSRRGGDLVMSGASGVRPYARIITATELVFPGVVFGDQDREGTPHSDPREGLTLNLDEIYEEVLAIPATVAGTIAAIWHRADGAAWTADVHVEGFVPTPRTPHVVDFELSISIAAGRFVAP